MKGERWQKVRMRVLVRDGFCCQAHQLGLCTALCGEHDLDELHVHHRQARAAGGRDELDNLLTLCRAHHVQLHPWMARLLPLKQREADYPLREL